MGRRGGMLELLLLVGLGAVAASNAADNSESKKEDKEDMEDDAIPFQSMGYLGGNNSLAKLYSSSLFPRDDEDGVRSISNEFYHGKTINAPKNSIMVFKDCTFERCTFVFKS
jgi:hypothetical protein